MWGRELKRGLPRRTTIFMGVTEGACLSDSRLQQHPLISSFRRQKIMTSPERSQQQVDSNSQLFNEKLKRSVSRIDH